MTMKLRHIVPVLTLPVLASACGGQTPGDEPVAESTRAVLSAPLFAPHSARFTVDNVEVTISSRLPFGEFSASAPGKARQLAWSVSHNPFRYVGIQVIPYGFGSPLERSFVSRPGASALHRDRFASQHGSEPVAAPPQVLTASLLGKSVPGAAYVRPDENAAGGYRGTAEFVTEAGGRVWIVSVSEDLAAGDIGAFYDSLRGLSLSSSDLDRATTLTAPTTGSVRSDRPLPEEGPAQDAAADLNTGSYRGKKIDTPSWWSDAACDKTNYWNHTPPSVPAASLLTPGAHVPNPWNGLPACGPNPYLYAGAADVLSTLPGGWGEYEFECVELSMRFLYGAYGVKAYGADGNGVANNYRTTYGGGLQRVPNGGAPPLPVAGDVLQYRCGTHGHTSVVVSESHDSNGTGGLYVIEQNNGPGAGNYIPETRWTVGCDSSGCCVDAWLHQP
jgi:hypothetical protein